MSKFECRNEIELLGRVTSEPVEKNSYRNTVFYEFRMAAKRLSNTEDHYRVHVSNHILEECTCLEVGKKVKVYGTVQTFIEKEEGKEKGRQIIFIMVDSICAADENEEDICDVDIRGYLCKRHDERRTRSDMRITDFIVACNRRGKKCDYIPSIAWNKQSHFIQDDIMIGDLISCHGRLQSRTYRKKLDDEGNFEEREVNEFSLSSCQLVKKGRRHLVADGEWVEDEVTEATDEEVAEVAETSEE